MKKLGIITSIAACAFLAFSVVPAGAQTPAGATDVSVAVTSAEPSATPAPASVTSNLKLFPSLAAPAASSSGDSFHRINLFVGYSFLGNDLAVVRANGFQQLEHGYAGSATLNLSENFGLLVDFSGHNGSLTVGGTHQTEDQYYFLAGPVVGHTFGKARISGHVLVGVSNQHLGVSGVGEKEGNFAAGVGGAFDWMFSHHVGWRVLQFDYLTSIFNNSSVGPFSGNGRVNNVRGSTGLVFHLK